MLFVSKKNVADFVYDVNAVDHCLSCRIELFQVRWCMHTPGNDLLPHWWPWRTQKSSQHQLPHDPSGSKVVWRIPSFLLYFWFGHLERVNCCCRPKITFEEGICINNHKMHTSATIQNCNPEMELVNSILKSAEVPWVNGKWSRQRSTHNWFLAVLRKLGVPINRRIWHWLYTGNHSAHGYKLKLQDRQVMGRDNEPLF